MLLLRLALLAAILTGCANKDLPDYFRLDKLRVLAIQADTPEVNPSSGPVTVNLKPVLSGVNGAQSALTYQLETCADPGVGYGIFPVCTQDPLRPAAQTGSLTLPSPNYTGPVAETLTVSVPSYVFAGRNEQDKFNGVAYLVLLTVSSPNGEIARAFRRLVATTRTPLNTNPTLTAIQVAGANITNSPGVAADLAAVIGTGAESYSVKILDGTLSPRKETLTISWFSAGGSFKFSRTDSTSVNAWTPPAAGTTGPIFLYAIIRDDRGGVGLLPAPLTP